MNMATLVPRTPEGPRPLLRPIPPGQPYPVRALGPLREAVEEARGEPRLRPGARFRSARAGGGC